MVYFTRKHLNMERIRKSDVAHGASNVRRVVKLHRVAQLHVECFNILYAPMNAALHVFIIACVIVSVYGCVRIEGWFAFALGYIATFCLLLYLFICRSYADINWRSKTVLQSLRVMVSGIQKGRLSCKAVDREQRSMTELRVRPGTAFYYDRALVLTVLQVIVTQSVSMLMIH